MNCPTGMNWLRHELQNKVLHYGKIATMKRIAFQFMRGTRNSLSQAKIHENL
jgi:hypothetical protein